MPRQATVRVVQTLVNDTASPVTVRVHQELRSLTSGRVHEFGTEIEVPAGGSADAAITTRLPDPELWSDADPRLHRLTTTLVWLSDGEERRAVYDETVGVRTFRFDPDNGFSINGEARVLKGVCLHEDAGCFGTAVPASVWLRRLLKLKEMGCNAVRMAHNPHAPELYALCDILGLYVIDEAFDEWENPKNKWWQGHNVYPPRHEGYAKDFHAWHELDLGAMIDAHRNHPSIIAWSIGNEIDYPNDPYAHPLFKEAVGNNDAGKPKAERLYDPDRPDIRRLTTIAKRLAGIVREKDPTRPVTLAAALPELSSQTGLPRRARSRRLQLQGAPLRGRSPAVPRQAVHRQRELAPLRRLAAGRAERLRRRSVPVDRHRLPGRGARLADPRLRGGTADARGLREGHVAPPPQLVVGRAGGAPRRPARTTTPTSRRPSGRTRSLARLGCRGRAADRGAVLRQRRRAETDVRRRGRPARARRASTGTGPP